MKKSLNEAEGTRKEGKERVINPVKVHKLLREELYKNAEGKKCIAGNETWNKDRGKNRFLNFHQREYDYNELERLF